MPSSGITEKRSCSNVPEFVGSASRPPAEVTGAWSGSVTTVEPLMRTRDCVPPKASFASKFQRPSATANVRDEADFAPVELVLGVELIGRLDDGPNGDLSHRTYVGQRSVDREVFGQSAKPVADNEVQCPVALLNQRTRRKSTSTLFNSLASLMLSEPLCWSG